MAKQSTKVLGVLIASAVIGVVSWLVWSAKNEQAARDLTEAQTELNLHEAEQENRLLDLRIEFGYEVFGHGSKGKTYELCLKYPPEVKRNQKPCAFSSRS